MRRGLSADLDRNTNCDLVVPVQHAYLDIFCTCLNDLEQTFDCQFD